MAELLYRLGAFAARRAWRVVAAWFVVLLAAGAGFVMGFGTLTTSFDIPDTASADVIEELERELPDFSGASGTVVFQTADGTAFTEGQRAEISALIEDTDGLPDVADVVDPFATEEQRAARERELADGRDQIEDGRLQLDEGQAQLDQGVADLDAAQAALDTAREQAQAAGAPPEQLALLDEQQAQLDEARDQLAQEQDNLDASRTELIEQSEQLELGAELLSLAADIRMVSEDGSTALVNVAFTEPRLDLSDASKEAVIAHFESDPVEGVEVSFSTDIAQGVPEILGVGEVVGVGIAAVVLLVMLGTAVAAALPIVTALVGVGIGVLATLAFSDVVQMASITPVLGVMLGLAVGIDYSLFIINRHRKQLQKGADVVESIGVANGTAGNAVVFAGSTVVVALLALNITGIPFLGLMGSAAAVCVAVAVLMSISLTPALLGMVGQRVLPRRARADSGEPRTEPAAPKPMGTLRAVLTVLATAAALLTLAIPALSMRLGLPDGSSEPADSASHRAFVVTEEAFGAGANAPLLVTADLPPGLADDELLSAQLTVARAIAERDDVTAVAPIAVSDDNALAAFQVVPSGGPNSESTEALVHDLRGLAPVEGEDVLGVAGQAAINIDISEGLQEVLPVYLIIVVGLSLLIMIVVFRSLLVPLIATGGFILSLFATYGTVVAVFQWGWLADLVGVESPGPILSFLPVILVGILFGLAMDYQLFLASGMREAYVHGSSARLAVAQGFRAGRSVVIAAGLIMVAVFGGFVFSESVIIRPLGFGLAFGILVDAFVVRMLLMPALMHLLSKSAWWLPRGVDRVLPNVDVEGAALERRHALH
ncbi:RND superfamily putative drug exporter [Stackebrandtia albiflava]|uniref:RND superfamily putative drug exporter n=1 Tax=Stackebrandtia albiflava TaxID=406432 RepID=A0A562URM8_9ACTN|nr:MMPL family transporter [Stackebrandtia albiflava]TWJ08273.1 RND superfamily putative drug exporter [Stackebrandtia albiflava]